jgi:hypothetical protein
MENNKTIKILSKIVYNPFTGPALGLIGAIIILFAFNLNILIPSNLREKNINKIITYNAQLGYKPIAFINYKDDKNEIIFMDSEKKKYFLKLFNYVTEVEKKNLNSSINDYLGTIYVLKKRIHKNTNIHFFSYKDKKGVYVFSYDKNYVVLLEAVDIEENKFNLDNFLVFFESIHVK